MNEREKHYCRICGLYNQDLPWGNDGASPNYDFCFCCGVEFGNQDYTLAAIRNFRNSWLSQGANWKEPSHRPSNWDLVKQLEQISEEFK